MLKSFRALALLPLLLPAPAFGQAFTGPATITQPTTPNDCVKVGNANNLVDAGAACGTGTVTSVSGTANQVVVANGTTAPVVSISPTLSLPGSLTGPNASFGGLSLSANAILAAGPSGSRAGAGTVTNSALGTSVAGVGTHFTADFVRGAPITINAETQYVVSIASDTSMTTSAWTGANTGAAYTIPAVGSGVATYPSGRSTFGGTASTTYGAVVDASRNYQVGTTAAYAPTISGGIFAPALGATGAAFGGTLLGGNFAPNVDTTNTQNWTNTPGLTGINVTARVQAGVSGTITAVAGINVSALGTSSSTAPVTNAFGMRIAAPTVTSAVTNSAGISIDAANNATNNTALYIANSGGSFTIPSGNWGINDQSARNWTMGAAITSVALVAGGSTPTLTGTCTTGSKTGGNTAGTFTATCVSQTVIIGFATTAPTGWSCNAHDQTTPADSLNQTASSATSCTLTGTTVASDVITFNARAY